MYLLMAYVQSDDEKCYNINSGHTHSLYFYQSLIIHVHWKLVLLKDDYKNY